MTLSKAYTLHGRHSRESGNPFALMQKLR